ncbi:MAG: hypothetical protein ACJAWL_003298 [Motiliproteus sp.]|jgi:uncharacterized protein
MTLDRAENKPLDEHEIDELETFLFSDAVSEESLDYPSLHGLLTAIAVCPVAIDEAEWLETLFDGKPEYVSAEQQTRIESLLRRELLGIQNELEHEEPPELPCDLSLDEDSFLTIWCQGFMEGVFMREDVWFGSHEEQMAELLLPMMIASDLFVDDVELQTMRNDATLMQGLCGEIPDLLTDIYLLFRVPEPSSKGPAKQDSEKK